MKAAMNYSKSISHKKGSLYEKTNSILLHIGRNIGTTLRYFELQIIHTYMFRKVGFFVAKITSDSIWFSESILAIFFEVDSFHNSKFSLLLSKNIQTVIWSLYACNVFRMKISKIENLLDILIRTYRKWRNCDKLKSPLFQKNSNTL